MEPIWNCQEEVKVLLIHTLSQLRLKIHLCGQEHYLPSRKDPKACSSFLSFLLFTQVLSSIHYWYWLIKSKYSIRIMPFLSQNIDSTVDFLWDVDNFNFFALVSPGNFHSTYSRLIQEWAMKVVSHPLWWYLREMRPQFDLKWISCFGGTSSDEPASQLLKVLEQNVSRVSFANI